jgi:protein-histidine N-methyltransferase
MGKKKATKTNTNNPESLKEAGNKAFLAKDYIEAIKLYTQAIKLSQAQGPMVPPSHIYFSNRANGYLEIGNLEDSLSDCNESIKIDPSYIKTYFRKAKTLL